VKQREVLAALGSEWISTGEVFDALGATGEDARSSVRRALRSLVAESLIEKGTAPCDTASGRAVVMAFWRRRSMLTPASWRLI
jgi:predicted transcriptional regulator